MKIKPPAFIRAVFIVAIIMVNIGCDQVSKHLVRRDIGYYQNIDFLNGHFTLTKVENAGAFLSLGDHIPSTIKFILLTLIPLIILVAGVIYLITKNNLDRVPLVAACFVIGGGIGNVYDRLLYGSVTDFMHIGFGIFQTGIFNMADLSVTNGVIMLAIWYYLKSKQQKRFSERGEVSPEA